MSLESLLVAAMVLCGLRMFASMREGDDRAVRDWMILTTLSGLLLVAEVLTGGTK